MARAHVLASPAATAPLLVVPALHPLLIPLVGIPSHLLWWIHVLPVAAATYRLGSRGAWAVLPLSTSLVVAGERLFGRGYGTPADWETVGALVVALTLTNLLVAGFSLYAQAVKRQLLHNALHDALTGLPNRALFMDRLEQSIARARRRVDYVLGVLFIDLDRFKIVNDGLGHACGDELLVDVAHRLSQCMRSSDTVARVGGDEFLVLLDDMQDVRDACRLADRVMDELRPAFRLKCREVFATVSIGIKVCREGNTSAAEIVRDADIAMYRAKARGRARAEMFDEEMYAAALQTVELETDLRRAIDRDELRLQFQPIVSLATGEVVAVETLVRWQHPRLGLLLPSGFLPLAEDTGIASALGEWVLRSACRAVRRVEHAGGLAAPAWRISVNMSAQQFASPGLATRVAEIIRETEVGGHRLAIEITENAMMNVAAAMSTMRQLKPLGVQFWIDDFGTGYSSLNYLRRFPVDVLKIDKSFIDECCSDGQMAIIRTILTLARELGMSSVAEGVETIEQVDELWALGCDAAQGYFFLHPADDALSVRHVSLTTEPRDPSAVRASAR